MPVAQFSNPLPNHSFSVKILEPVGRAKGSPSFENDIQFSKISPITFSTSTKEIVEFDKPFTSTKILQKAVYNPIVLSNGMVEDFQLWEWRQKAADDPKNNLKTVIIYVTAGSSNENDPRVQITLMDAWPIEYTLGELEALGNSIFIQSLKLQFNDLKIEKF